VSEEWLQTRFLRFMLCCGVAWTEFSKQYEKQTNEEKQRILKVAWRMWVSQKLRYGVITNNHIPTMGWDVEFKFTDTEWPSIEVYLLATCLDTLAGKPDFHSFDEWLQKQPFYTNLDTHGVISLLNKYRKSHGPRHTIRELFINLSPHMKTWLSQNVIIQKANKPFGPEEINQNPETITKRLFEYFYDFRRNEFTHGSVTRQTSKAHNITSQDNRWTRSLAGWEYSTDKKRYWSFYHRHGIDEATILRIIIQAVVLQKLKIETDSEVIERNIVNQSRISALYGYVNELRRNANELYWWSRFDENAHDAANLFVGHSGIPRLKSLWTEILIERLTDHSLEVRLKQMAVEYLDSVRKLNLRIDDFNASKPSFSPSVSSNTGIWHQVMKSAKSLFEELAETEEYLVVLEALQRKEMGKLRLVIRDPCYS